MVNLAAFLIAEYGIINSLDDTVTLVKIIDTITIGIPPGASIPDNLAAPRPWVAFAQWGRVESDADESFDQRVQLFTPDGVKVSEGHITFTIRSRSHRTLIAFEFFPISQPGEYRIVAEVREVDTDEPWEYRGECPFFVVHQHVPPSDEEGDGASLE